MKDSKSNWHEVYFAAKFPKKVLEASINLRDLVIERKVFNTVQYIYIMLDNIHTSYAVVFQMIYDCVLGRLSLARSYRITSYAYLHI